MSRGLGLALPLSVGVSRAIFPVQYFGTNLVLAVNSSNVTVSGGNVIAAKDLSPAGNNLTGNGTTTYSPNGGVNNLPFVTFGSGNLNNLNTSNNLVATNADRTVYHVFKALPATVDLLAFRQTSASFTVRFSSVLSTTSDEATFNNTGTYTFDSTAVHILESQYHLGSVSTYILDGSTITQGGASVSTAETGSAGFIINGQNNAATFGQIWYATYVVNKVTNSTDDAKMLAWLQSVY